MTEDQRRKLDRLIRCTMAPGSEEKRFVRQLHAASDDFEPSEKQAAWIEKVWHRYRKQLGHDDPPPGGE